MAAPIVRGRTAPVAGGAATSPASTAVGDMVIVFTWERAGAGVPTHTLQSTFVEIRTHSHDDGSTDGRLSVAYKIATSAGATSYQAYTSSTGTPAWWTGIVVLTTGTFDTASIASNSVTSTTNAVPNPPSVTLGATKDWLVLAIGAWHHGSAATITPTAPTNYANLIEVAGSSNGDLGIADRSLTAAASEDPAAFGDNIAPNGTVAMTIGIAGVANATPTPSTVAASGAVPAPTTQAASLTAPSSIAATSAVPTSTLAATAIPTPTEVSAPAAVPAPTTEATAVAQPSTASAIAAVPAPSIIIGGDDETVSPATVAAVTAVPSSTVKATASVSPSTVPVPAAIPSTEVSAAAVALPATITGTTAVPAPSIDVGGADATPEPASVAATTQVPAPSVATGAVSTVSTVGATSTIPTPTIIAGGLGTPVDGPTQADALAGPVRSGRIGAGRNAVEET
jgi:hypothetical protein